MRFPGQMLAQTKREAPTAMSETARSSSACSRPSGRSSSITTNGVNGKTVSDNRRRGTGGDFDPSVNHMTFISASSRNDNTKGSSTNRRGYGGTEARRRGQIDQRFTVRRDPSRGRGIFALEAVPAGTEVLVAKQAAAVPRDRYRAAFCRRCLTLLDKKSLIKCRRCEDHFCGKECVIAAAGEGTHEATCAFVEDLGEERLEKMGEGLSTAATDREILRLAMDCLSRRSAGLSDQDEWVEIEDLDLGTAGFTDYGECDSDGTLDADVIRAVEARLGSRGLVVTVEEMQTVHRR